MKSTGPGSASPGENVTLIGNLIGIATDQLGGVQFSQESGTTFPIQNAFVVISNVPILVSLLFCQSVRSTIILLDSNYL